MFFAISAIPLLQRNSDWLPTEIPNTYNTYHHTLVRTVTLHIVFDKDTVQKDGKVGVIDITEKALIPFIYDNIGAFSNCTDSAPAIKNKKQEFINRKGEIIIPLEYDTNSYLTYFQEPGLAILIKNAHNVVKHIQNKPSHEF